MRLLMRSQHNAWIHAMATVAVVAFGLWTRLAAWEWCALVLAIGLVWVGEALNTALEFLADEVSREKRELIGKAKDVGAAGVLIAAITSVVIGLLVFLPHLAAWFAGR
jgi:diacylglycerol kinase (ATP)